ncbi:MAG: hypothetical protein NTW55_07825 [Planctomycetota bacterium]|nr:hypothetical protein [Planctomycetota bacterium]
MFFHRPQGVWGYGVVRGVLYVAEDSSVLIDDHIVKEGETIYGVKVVKIDRDAVEFSKYRKTWKQKVLEKPNPAWNEEE